MDSIRLKKFVGAVALVAVVLLNIRAERSKPDRAGMLVTALHTVVFIMRKGPTILITRMLGAGGQKGWTAFEEFAMRVLNFSAHVGDISIPHKLIDVYGRANQAASVLVHGVNVTNIGPELLGFGPGSSGLKKFGEGVQCTGKWVALDGDTKFLGRNVKCLLYYHGGGYCFGNSLMYLSAFAKLLRLLAAEGVQAGILSIDYPLAPKFQFPVPINAGIHVFDFLVMEKRLLKPEDVIALGDSAGGNLATNLGLRATKVNLAGLVLISPWVGFKTDTVSQTEFAGVDLIGGQLLQEQFKEGFMPGGRCQSVSMLHFVDKHGPFASLPPCFLTYGEVEVFRDDIQRFANALESQDTPVTVFVGQDAPHIFPMLWPLFSASSEPALKYIAEFCATRFVEAAQESKVRAKSALAFAKMRVEGNEDVYV